MKTTTLALMAAGLLALASSAPAARAVDFKVIVHTSASGNAVTKTVLQDIYLGRTQRWADRSLITPVDQSATSPVRATFSDSVLGMPVFAVQTHWMRQMAVGIRPPVTKPTDAEVIELVQSRPGSIGYVSGDAALPAGVRAIDLR